MNDTVTGSTQHLSPETVLAQMKKTRSGPAFNPPSLQGTVVIP